MMRSVLCLLLLTSACGFLDLLMPKQTPSPTSTRINYERQCAATWDMYSSPDKKIEVQMGEFFDLNFRLNKGKIPEEHCEFIISDENNKVTVYQWQAKGHGQIKDKVISRFLEGEIVQDELKFNNLFFASDRTSYIDGAKVVDLPLLGKLKATAVPYVRDNSGYTDSKQPFALIKNSDVTGELEFDPANDVFVFRVRNGKANSDYKITIATNAENSLLGGVVKSLEKEITLDSSGQGQVDIPIFSRVCIPEALARITGEGDDRITPLYADFPCIGGKGYDGEISTTIDTQGTIGIEIGYTMGIRDCKNQDGSIKGKVEAFLNHIKYSDFTKHENLNETLVKDDEIDLSIDTDEVLKGNIGTIPDYDPNSCYYVRSALSINCCSFNAAPPVVYTSPPPPTCRDVFSAYQKLGNGCSS